MPEHNAISTPAGRFNHLHLVEIELDTLRIPERSLRCHPTSQIRRIARSIEAFGWVTPILITSDGELIAGAARVAAARSLGLKHAPAVCVDHLTPEQVRAFRIADNRLAEESDWDREALRVEIEDLLQCDLDIELTGFEIGEIDALTINTPGINEPEFPEPPRQPVTRPGDVWEIGNHTLVCGDALDPRSYAHLDQTRAQAAFTDAPYNVPIDRNVCGLGNITHDEFIQASGELSRNEFAAFLLTAHENLAAHLQPGAVAFSCMDWRSIAALLEAGDKAGFELINLAVWDKGTGGMGSLYRSQHELVAVLRKPGARNRNNVLLGKHGRNRTNVWAYSGMNAGAKERSEILALHPTVKPVAMVADAILDVTRHGDLVLDPFGGSGTTMIAAEQTGRRAFLIELDPKYVDVIISRMQAAFQLVARHAQTGQSFEEVGGARGACAGDGPEERRNTGTGGAQ